MVFYVKVSIECFVVFFCNNSKMVKSDFFFDFSNIVCDVFFNSRIVFYFLIYCFFKISRSVCKKVVSKCVQKFFEVFVFCNEISFRVYFQDNVFVVVSFNKSRIFSSDMVSFFSCFCNFFFFEKVDCFVYIFVSFS